MSKIKGVLPWVGGKSKLVRKIVPLFPEHTCYCEVFVGAGWVLFGKEPSKVEVINDINVELVTLYRVIEHHLDEFVRFFRWILTARNEFERFKATDPNQLTDIQRAVRFFYLVKTAYGAKFDRPTFGVSTTSPPRLNLLRIEEDLSAAHLRLSRVVIENLPYAAFIERYDRPHTLFYLDPPYYGCENDYGSGIFERADFERMADQLAGIKGRFIMSINDVPEIRRVFSGFNIQEVETRYSVGSADRGAVVRELLVMNYDPPRT
jgi:DNA adenine methylase